MPDPAVVDLIERVVAAARIPRRARREELRRELYAHFEDAGTSPEAVRDAVRRFGHESLVAGSFRRVYRWDYAFFCLTRVIVSGCLAAVAALLIEAIVSIRAGGFSHAIVPALTVAMGIVAGREIIRRLIPNRAWSVARWSPWIFASLAFAEYAMHHVRGIALAPVRVLMAAAILMLIWTATVAIAARVDRAFARSLETV